MARTLAPSLIAAALFAFVAFPFPAAAQLQTPQGWRKESFRFPLPYAPSLPYEGTEEVRFSPSWTHFSEEGGFSYVVLWDIEPAALEPEALERALGVYFDGLMNNVAIARKIDAMVTQTTASLHPLDVPAGWSDAYAGVVHTWNGFSKAEDLALHVEVTKRPCGPARVQVLFAIARAPRSATAVWEPLRNLRQAAACAS